MMRALCLLACIMVTAALTAQPLELSPASDYADSPSMSVANSGDVFVAWIGYDGKGADAVRLRRFTGGMWSEPETVSEKPGDFYKTAVATTPDGRVWIAWAARVDGNVDIYARAWAAGQWSSTTRLTRDPQPDIHHRLLAGADGKLYLCWQSFRTGDGNIYLKVFDGQAWTEPIPITTHEAGDWEPDIAIDAQGRLHIVYDTYRHGDYDVFLRIHDRGNLSPEHPVAATESFEARATVICDRQGRAWVAWDDQGPGWGLDRPLWKQNARQGDWGPPANWAAEDPAGGVSHKVSLRVTQSIGVAVVTQGGRATPVGKLAEALGDPLALTYEIPHLALDADGTPWLFFRRWIARNDGSGMAIRPGGWEIHATHYTGSSWSAPRKLARSAGSNGQRVATVNGPDRKLWIAYPVDDRQAPDTRIEVQAKRHGRVLFTKLDPVRGDEPALAGLEPAASRPFRRTAPPDRRNRIAAGEKRYQLYWGDLHRHTEISDDGGYDGTLWDMYRYAMDVAELDFIASTDHFYGGSGGDERAETYDWWRTQKLADLMHVRGSFLPFFGYERSLRWPYGHRNVINLKRGTTAFNKTVNDRTRQSGDERVPDEVALWKQIRGQDVITIPHTIAAGGGTDWSYNDPLLEPLMEIYQGCRMSYETEGGPRVGRNLGDKTAGLAWSALEKGYKVGFIASSDHRSTHISYAAVYAEAPTREAIFDGLRRRHAYAATDNIVVDVRMEDAILGDAITSARTPELRVSIRGTAPVAVVEIIKNGAYVYRREPRTREVAFTFRDDGARPGQSYYYVRLQQTDGQLAWASPIWMDYQP